LAAAERERLQQGQTALTALIQFFPPLHLLEVEVVVLRLWVQMEALVVVVERKQTPQPTLVVLVIRQVQVQAKETMEALVAMSPVLLKAVAAAVALGRLATTQQVLWLEVAALAQRLLSRVLL
jgi:hypothetical protein